MPIDKAIETYVDFTSKVFSAGQIGLDGKFNTKTFENTIKNIVRSVMDDPDECLLDQRPNACKV